MDFYLIEQTQDSKAGELDATHQWTLPGVVCSICGSTWGAVGLEYPSVDLGNMFKFGKSLPEEPVLVEEFDRLRLRIQKSFPFLERIMPGTQFGHSVGRLILKPQKVGFVHGAWWTLYLTDSIAATLTEESVSLPSTVPVKLSRSDGESGVNILEFAMPLDGKLINGEYHPGALKVCGLCGRDSATLPNNPIIDISDRRAKTDIFRVSNFNTLLVCSDKFVDAVRRMEIPGLRFQPVETRIGPCKDG